MTCKFCGTDIADKAIICYKCGNATVEAQRKPAPLPPPGGGGWAGRLTILLALVALIVAGLYLGRAGGDVPPAVWYTIAGLAAAILVLRTFQRRR